VRKLIEPGAPAPDALRLERIADAIVSIEYYMETLQNGRNDPWYMLDNAETCIKALDRGTRARVPNVDFSRSGRRQDRQIDPEATGSSALEAAHRSSDRASPPRPRAAAPPVAAVDPQFLELFIEEAKEEIAAIQRDLPALGPESHGSGIVGKMRRSFHTLKGSGRMVGARSIAEFGWSIENLLNRLIDKTLSRTPGMMAVLRNAVAALPQLVEQLETGRQNLRARRGAHGARLRVRGRPRGRAGFGASMAPEDRDRAGRFSPCWRYRGAGPPIPPDRAPRMRAPPTHCRRRRGEPPTRCLGAAAPACRRRRPQRAPPPAPGRSPAPRVGKAGPDGSRSCTRSTARKRRAISRKFAITCASAAVSRRRTILPESVYRAIHTLSGSSKMAEARHGIRIAEPLNHYMRKVFDSGRA
jgi:chemosensory pili system protein ChpA (sensor histidine kinase/response regulator)